MTHVLPIQNLHLCAKKTREAFEKEQLTIPSPMLNEKKRDWILQLSKKNTQNNIDGDSEENEILNFQHVSIRYGKRTILKDLSWIVHQGEHWALSGENGSGKSTLLSLVCADNPQGYACDIRLFGRKRGSGERKKVLFRFTMNVFLHQISFLPVMMIFVLLSFRNILTIRILMPFGWCVAVMAAFV